MGEQKSQYSGRQTSRCGLSSPCVRLGPCQGQGDPGPYQFVSGTRRCQAEKASRDSPEREGGRLAGAGIQTQRRDSRATLGFGHFEMGPKRAQRMVQIAKDFRRKAGGTRAPQSPRYLANGFRDDCVIIHRLRARRYCSEARRKSDRTSSFDWGTRTIFCYMGCVKLSHPSPNGPAEGGASRMHPHDPPLGNDNPRPI